MKNKNIYLHLTMILSLSIFVFSSMHIFSWLEEKEKIKHLNEKLKEQAVIEEDFSQDESFLVNPPVDKNDSYWNYIEVPFLQANFSELYNQNPDTVAWIQVMGTKVDYPVVQAENNSFYLNHSFDKTESKAGWIFSDYRNNFSTLHDNTIIYGHARLDDTMFGSLRSVLEDSWYQNSENHIIKLSTPKMNSIWQIFSVYTILKESYYIKNHFYTIESFQNFLATISKRSRYSFQTAVNEKDKILTLSTCQDNYGNRIVIHAKLIKKETLSF